MMFQWFIVGGIVAGCAGYLLRLTWRMLHGRATSCGCSDCPSQRNS